MITSALLLAVYWLVYGLIFLLPTGGVFPADFLSSLNMIWNAISLFSLVVPINTLLTILGLSMLWHAFVWAWNTMLWILSIVRGVNMLR